MHTNSDSDPRSRLPDGSPLSHLYESQEAAHAQPTETHWPDGAPMSHLFGPEDVETREENEE